MPPLTAPIIYTVGYASGWLPEDLLTVATRLDSVVVDTRFTPLSRWAPKWNKNALAALLGDRYVWLKALGNENYKNDGPVKLVDPELGAVSLLPVISAGASLILLCACKDQLSCHRTNAAAFLAAKFGLDIIHLGTAKQELAEAPTPTPQAPQQTSLLEP